MLERTIAKMKALKKSQWFWTAACLVVYGAGVYYNSIFIVLLGMVPQYFAVMAWIPIIRSSLGHIGLPRSRRMPRQKAARATYVIDRKSVAPKPKPGPIWVGLPKRREKPVKVPVEREPGSVYFIPPPKVEAVQEWKKGLGFLGCCNCGTVHSVQCVACGMTREMAKKKKGMKWVPLPEKTAAK